MRVTSIGEEIGRGAFAVVHRACVAADDADGQPLDVVIKMSRTESSSIPWEASVLDHVRTHAPPPAPVLAPLWAGDVLRTTADGSVQRTPSMILRRAAGGDALQWIAAQVYPIPVSTCVSVCRDLVRSLHAFHSNGIAHLDVSLENILFIDNHRCCLSDAGMARNLMPAMHMWSQMPSALVVDALDAFVRAEVYKLVLSGASEEEVATLIQCKMQVAASTQRVLASLRRLADLAPELRRTEAWEQYHRCTLRVSSMCAQLDAAWYSVEPVAPFGRKPYRPPESLVCHSVPTDLLAWDVWTLGVCMFAVMFRRLPFDSVQCVRFEHFKRSNCGVASLLTADQRGRYPAELLQIVDACLTIRPSERIRTRDLAKHPLFAH